MKKEKKVVKKATPVRKVIKPAPKLAPKSVKKPQPVMKSAPVPKPSLSTPAPVASDGFREYQRSGRLSARAFIRRRIKDNVDSLAKALRKAGYYPGFDEEKLLALVTRYHYHIQWELVHTMKSGAKPGKLPVSSKVVKAANELQQDIKKAASSPSLKAAVPMNPPIEPFATPLPPVKKSRPQESAETPKVEL
jgi:hypothetical protein